MKFGIVFPQTEIGNDPAIIRDYACAVEELGYSYLLAYDHVLGANPDREGGWNGPYTHATPFHEVFILFSHLAALTSRLELVTGVLVLPQRQTSLVAKQVAQLDLLSNERFRLGVGVGWNDVEYEGLGEDFSNRGKRIEEQVVLLRRLWNEPLINFQSEFHHLNDVGINPLPKRSIPIWFGGSADVVLQRMAKLGDGWMANSSSMERLKESIDKLHSYLDEVGRNRDNFGIDVRLNVTRHNPDTWPDLIQQYQALGVTHISLNTMGLELAVPHGHLDILENFATHMGLS